MASPGLIYILINPSLKDLLKIGKTTRDAEERAKELSDATGVPTPFIVAFEEFFEDCDYAEKYIHEILQQKGFRINESREFFSIPLKDAVRVLIEAKTFLALELKTNPRQVENNELPVKPSINNAAEELLKNGLDHYFGWGEAIEDQKKGHKIIKQAATLGSAEACLWLSAIYEHGLGCKANPEKALDYVNEAIRLGGETYYAHAARFYYERSQYNNAEKCWKFFFDYLSKAKIIIKDIESDLETYLIQVEGIDRQRRTVHWWKISDIHVGQCADLLGKSKKQILQDIQEKYGPTDESKSDKPKRVLSSVFGR